MYEVAPAASAIDDVFKIFAKFQNEPQCPLQLRRFRKNQSSTNQSQRGRPARSATGDPDSPITNA